MWHRGLQAVPELPAVLSVEYTGGSLDQVFKVGEITFSSNLKPILSKELSKQVGHTKTRKKILEAAHACRINKTSQYVTAGYGTSYRVFYQY